MLNLGLYEANVDLGDTAGLAFWTLTFLDRWTDVHVDLRDRKLGISDPNPKKDSRTTPAQLGVDRDFLQCVS